MLVEVDPGGGRRVRETQVLVKVEGSMEETQVVVYYIFRGV